MWASCFLFQTWKLWPKEVGNHDRHPPADPMMCQALFQGLHTLGVLYLHDVLSYVYFTYIL